MATVADLTATRAIIGTQFDSDNRYIRAVTAGATFSLTRGSTVNHTVTGAGFNRRVTVRYVCAGYATYVGYINTTVADPSGVTVAVDA